MGQIRINKYLSQLGLASRRQIDHYISGKRILVNDKLANLGDKINPNIDTITIDNKIIPIIPPKLVYYALNKPPSVLSTSRDDRGRDTVLNYVPKSPRVFPVGRLDYQSTGLILLTNDGSLSLKITHPRYHLPKTYLVTLLGKIPQSKVLAIHQTGAKTKIISQNNFQTILEIILFQGKKRQIRLLCSSLHLHLLKLHRIAIGPIKIGSLAPGKYRELSTSELKSIRL